jgi:hypothetical protein
MWLQQETYICYRLLHMMFSLFPWMQNEGFFSLNLVLRVILHSGKYSIISSFSLVWDMGSTVYVLNPQPQARYLHSAVTTDDYMLVFGGRSHYNTSNSLIAYTYSCNQWLRLLTSGLYLFIFALIMVNEMMIIMNSTNVFKDKFNP